jgi:LacI family transcriptional regulator
MTQLRRAPGSGLRLRVALLIESSRGYGRELLVGIAKYLRIHGPWSIEFEEGDPGERLPQWIDRWQWDGIIARVKTPAVARSLHRLGVPVVDLYGSPHGFGFPSIRSDEVLIGRMAAEHLLDRGFRRFAYCGYNGTWWSDLRRLGFEKRVTEAGFPCQSFGNPLPLRPVTTPEYEEHGARHEEELQRWLASLPMPVGLMACNDSRGRQVLNGCREARLAVPDDVAVIGVDRDEILCELSDVPLSSVILNAQQIGYEAASLLQRMMSGEVDVGSESILVQPLGLATRRSTDVLAIEDRPTAAALRLIREHACEGINVPFLAKAVGVSRRSLERRMAQVLGRPPNAEILRVRLEHVCRLLTESGLPLSQVAAKAGFENAEYLARLFKKRFGMTLGEFRKVTAVATGPVSR